MKARDVCRISMMTAMLCALGPIAIPLGPVPLSLATLAVYLAGALLGAKRGMLAVGMYLLLGALGMPVFSGFSAGVQKIAGPTGGYLLGYMLCAAIVGVAAENGAAGWQLAAAMAVGTVLCYGLGTVWFMAQTGTGFAGAALVCVIPFLPGDAVKIAAAVSAVGVMQNGLTSR